MRVPSGLIWPISTITTAKSGQVILPTLDFKKIGIYQLVISINGKASTLKVTVTN
jgi:hypothetical protein